MFFMYTLTPMHTHTHLLAVSLVPVFSRFNQAGCDSDVYCKAPAVVSVCMCV